MTQVKEKSFGLFILLNIVTLGFYSIFAYHDMGKHIEEFCDGDDEKQMVYGFAFLLGFVTFGIYPLIWDYRQMDRMKDNGYRYHLDVKYSGQDYLLWFILSTWFLGIGWFVGAYMFIHNYNQYAKVSGQVTPFPYTRDMALRNKYMYDWQSGGYGQGSGGYRRGYKTVPARKGKLVCTRGYYSGASFDVPANETVIIGRDPSVCAIIINGNSTDVSRRHMKIRYNSQSDKYTVTDISSNGSFFSNGQRMNNGMEYTLSKGTAIRLGGTEEFILN